MDYAMRRSFQFLLALAGIVCSFAAQAAYVFTNIDYPGADFTQCWAINNAGQVVCNAQVAAATVNFLYDPRKGTITPLPVPPGEVQGGVDVGYVGINERGVLAGTTSNDGITSIGVVLDKKNAFTLFQHPDRTDTVGRAVGPSGLVTGFAVDASGSQTGFIYDPKYDAYVDFLESQQTIAQGINGRDDVVGSTSSPPDTTNRYGFLRDKFGTITLFRVNGYNTRARGITDSGRIVGFVTTPEGQRAFVGTLKGLPASGGNIPDAVLLNVPGAVNTSAQGISNSGKIVGIWEDNVTVHGFIATPVK